MDNKTKFLIYYKKCRDDFSENLLYNTRQYSDKIFLEKSSKDEVKYCIDKISGTAGCFDKIQEEFEKHREGSNPHLKIHYCQALFDYCEMSQDWRELGNWLEEELHTLEEVQCNDSQNLAWLSFAYGRCLEETGRLNQSFDMHQQGILISQRQGYSGTLALNQLGIGIALQRFTERRDIEKASDYLVEALKFFDGCNPYQKANALLNLGSCYDRLGKMPQSIDCYQQCIDILKHLNNDYDLVRSYYSLGIAYLNSNQFKKAEESYVLGLKYDERSDNLYYRALIYYGISWLKYLKGDFSGSQEKVEESINIFNQCNDDFFTISETSFYESEGNIYLLAAASYCKASPIPESTVNHYLRKAENAYKKLEHPDRKLTQVLANRARLYEAMQEWNLSTKLFYQLLDQGKRLQLDNFVADAVIHLTRIFKKKDSSLLDWIILFSNLGISGFLSLFNWFIKQQNRSLNILKFIRN